MNTDCQMSTVMLKKNQKLIAYLSILGLFSVYGCTGAVIGAGAAAGAGTYSYFTGNMTKTYESEYHHTVEAVKSTLKKLEIPITDTIADGLKTEFKARRPDGTPVTIKIVLIDRQQTEVSVRTGTMGVWDRRVSEQIHGYISEALDQKNVGEEKPSEVLAEKSIQPTTEEGIQPKIIEEDLTEESAPAPIHAETTAAQILPDPSLVIFFDKDSNALSDNAVEKLNRISKILTDNSKIELTLNGYTDSYGDSSYNKMISEVRANVVKHYLVGKGINPSRIMAFGNGAQKFIGSNKSADGRKLNRRVEIGLITP
jgi:outer membrane protein OmpA-like peptidoglycan-associated protein